VRGCFDPISRFTTNGNCRFAVLDPEHAMRVIAATIAVLCWPMSLRADDAGDSAVKTAIDKAIQRIETGIRNYPKHRQCFSCHHQAMAVLSLTAAKVRGFSVDSDLLKKQVEFSLKTFRNKAIIAQGKGIGGDSTSVVYALNTFAAAELPYDDTMAALVE